MNLRYDILGFPIFEVPDCGWFHLWPITKYQFERFLAESPSYNDAWYEEVQAENPRITPQEINRNNYEQAFITGLLPREVWDFVRWLGGGIFTVPTVEQWRQAYRYLESLTVRDLPKLNTQGPPGYLNQILRMSAREPLRYTLMQQGLVEWVLSDQNEMKGLGAPRPAFLSHLWDPLRDIIDPIEDTRNRIMGLRLITY